VVAQLFHCLDRLGIHFARRLGAGAINLHASRRIYPPKGLGHLAAIGILDAEEDDARGHFAPTSDARFSAISLSSAFWGSANFLTPSSMSTFSIFATSTLEKVLMEEGEALAAFFDRFVR